MALPKVGDGYQVGDGNTGEVLVVGRSGQSIGFYGSAGGAQAATIASITTDAATSTTNAFGYSTSTQANAIVTALNSVITQLKAVGLIASS